MAEAARIQGSQPHRRGDGVGGEFDGVGSSSSWLTKKPISSLLNNEANNPLLSRTVEVAVIRTIPKLGVVSVGPSTPHDVDGNRSPAIVATGGVDVRSVTSPAASPKLGPVDIPLHVDSTTTSVTSIRARLHNALGSLSPSQLDSSSLAQAQLTLLEAIFSISHHYHSSDATGAADMRIPSPMGGNDGSQSNEPNSAASTHSPLPLLQQVAAGASTLVQALRQAYLSSNRHQPSSTFPFPPTMGWKSVGVQCVGSEVDATILFAGTPEAHRRAERMGAYRHQSSHTTTRSEQHAVKEFGKAHQSLSPPGSPLSLSYNAMVSGSTTSLGNQDVRGGGKGQPHQAGDRGQAAPQGSEALRLQPTSAFEDGDHTGEHAAEGGATPLTMGSGGDYARVRHHVLTRSHTYQLGSSNLQPRNVTSSTSAGTGGTQGATLRGPSSSAVGNNRKGKPSSPERTHHLTSEVVGRLRAAVGGDLLKRGASDPANLGRKEREWEHDQLRRKCGRASSSQPSHKPLSGDDDRILRDDDARPEKESHKMLSLLGPIQPLRAGIVSQIEHIPPSPFSSPPTGGSGADVYQRTILTEINQSRTQPLPIRRAVTPEVQVAPDFEIVGLPQNQHSVEARVCSATPGQYGRLTASLGTDESGAPTRELSGLVSSTGPVNQASLSTTATAVIPPNNRVVINSLKPRGVTSRLGTGSAGSGPVHVKHTIKKRF